MVQVFDRQRVEEDSRLGRRDLVHTPQLWLWSVENGCSGVKVLPPPWATYRESRGDYGTVLVGTLGARGAWVLHDAPHAAFVKSGR